ncbi:MAG: peptide deformylase [Ardenticatenia bacterium]|nr:peptide deformylase [Ardenticatenia bacterium]
MAIRQVLLASDPRLRQESKPVRQFGPALKALVDDMLETMIAGNGIGLAAPQIGLLQRLLVAHLPEDEDDPQSGKGYALINPRLVKVSSQQVEGVEGCLSIPTWYGKAWRPEWAVVKAKTVQGKPIRIKAEGYLARVFLHEMDHLDGILFTDHIENPEDLWQDVPEDMEAAEESGVAADAVVRVA